MPAFRENKMNVAKFLFYNAKLILWLKIELKIFS